MIARRWEMQNLEQSRCEGRSWAEVPVRIGLPPLLNSRDLKQDQFFK
jgi:hypothetical protein